MARYLLAFAMTAIGVDHFANPGPFVQIVPAFLPAPLMLVYLSGVCEMAFGVGLLFARTRLLSALGLVALYLAVFPANINMAIHQIQLTPESPIPVWAMWARLPFQALFIAWALYVRRDAPIADRPS